MSLSGSESRSGLVMELAEEFLDRYRKGQRPPLREYIHRTTPTWPARSARSSRPWP